MASRNEWPSSAGKWWEWETVPVVAAFFAYLIACWVVLPAEWTKGGLLRDGTRKEYKLNGGFLYVCLGGQYGAGGRLHAPVDPTDV